MAITSGDYNRLQYFNSTNATSDSISTYPIINIDNPTTVINEKSDNIIKDEPNITTDNFLLSTTNNKLNIFDIKNDNNANTDTNTASMGLFRNPKVSLKIRNLFVSTEPLKSISDGSGSTSLLDDSITSNGSKKTILNNISLDIPAGCVCGIIGGSGSGKTTLLNFMMSYNEYCVSNKTKQSNIQSTSHFWNKIVPSGNKLYIEGQYYLEAEENPTLPATSDRKQKEHGSATRIKVAYLQQQDILPNNLTPREILEISADLKLPHVSKPNKKKIVDQLLMELGLKYCSDTQISDKKTTLSGGEKRRLCIALQMISNPSIMFLDEPTTGLDSYTAILLMQTLNKLSSQYGTTFILSIHQPRSDIFEKMLDQLVILSTGNLIYTGKVNNMVGYFTQYCDLPLPSKFLNPCDYYIDCCSIDTRSEEMRLKSCAVLKKLAQKWQYYTEQHPYTPTTSIAQNYKFVSSSVGFIEQVKVQFFRSLKLSIRDKLTFFGSLGEPIIIGLVNGWIYYRPVANNKTQDPTILRTITASIYTGAALQSYLVLLFETYRLCEVDMKMYDMERLKVNRVVTPQSFFVARKLSKFLIEDFPIPLIFSIITYFMFGLDESHGEHNNTCKNFFIYFSVTLLMHQTSTNLALISVSLSRNFSQASLVGNLAYTLQSFACGFFVNAAKMPVYVRWTKYITFLWVSFGALLSNEFTSKSNSTYTGLLNSFGFPLNWITDPIVILFCWVIGMGGVVICLLHLKTIDISQVNSNVKFKDHSDNKNENKKSSSSDLEKVEEIQVDKISELHKKDVGVDVELRNINLKVNTNKEETIQILNDINAKFVKNKVNVIMGPSGSGKSTLLNYMANRLNSNDSFFQFSKQYKYTGQIILDDGEIVTDNVNFSKICSYVKQNDDHLLSRLTVWETLYYASKLRLTHLSDVQQKQQVEDIIMSLGLWHCKDTLVGDDWNKGISGGEKRRVSIGVQLLTRPKVVILDEPTSGLDSFTASTIMELLHKISHNTTVIVTIHQPRAEMFYKFGNVLLIAKGGYVVFNGTPTEMETFFFSNPNLRFRCPELTNIADFYLDLISLNTQNEVNEGISRKRVDKIINEWNKESQGMFSEIADTKNATIIVDGDRKAGFLTGYKVCLARQFKCIVRDINSLVARFTQVPGISIILALYFAPLKHNEISITNRLGLVQQSSSLYFTGMLGNLAVYPQERDAFYHEYADGVFTTASSFFLAYMTLELPMSFLASVIYSCFSVLVIGLPRTASNFFITVYGVFVFMACGESLGILTNTLFEQPGFVVNIISIIISIGCGMSGLMSLKMDKVLKGFNYLSPLNYITVSLINYAFPADLKIVLDNGDIITGPEVLKEYGLVRNNRNWLGASVACWFIYRLLAYIVLYIKLHKR